MIKYIGIRVKIVLKEEFFNEIQKIENLEIDWSDSHISEFKTFSTFYGSMDIPYSRNILPTGWSSIKLNEDHLTWGLISNDSDFKHELNKDEYTWSFQTSSRDESAINYFIYNIIPLIAKDITHLEFKIENQDSRFYTMDDIKTNLNILEEVKTDNETKAEIVKEPETIQEPSLEQTPTVYYYLDIDLILKYEFIDEISKNINNIAWNSSSIKEFREFYNIKGSDDFPAIKDSKDFLLLLENNPGLTFYNKFDSKANSWKFSTATLDLEPIKYFVKIILPLISEKVISLTYKEYSIDTTLNTNSNDIDTTIKSKNNKKMLFGFKKK